MKLLHKVSPIFWDVTVNLIFSQPDNDIIIEDTWDPRIDKISHATASFGFYYTLLHQKIYTNFEIGTGDH